MPDIRRWVWWSCLAVAFPLAFSILSWIWVAALAPSGSEEPLVQAPGVPLPPPVMTFAMALAVWIGSGFRPAIRFSLYAAAAATYAAGLMLTAGGSGFDVGRLAPALAVAATAVLAAEGVRLLILRR